MASSARRSASAFARIDMKWLPRWLISITDMPLPSQSSNSACARCSTGSGMAAGPALKFHTRFVIYVPSARRVTRQLHLVVVVTLDDPFEPRQLLALVEIDQRDALRGAAHFADRLHARADQHTRRRDQHDLVVGTHECSADHLAVAARLLDRNHSLRATAVPRVFDDRRALAVPLLGGGQHRLFLVLGDEHRDHLLPLV